MVFGYTICLYINAYWDTTVSKCGVRTSTKRGRSSQKKGRGTFGKGVLEGFDAMDLV